MSDDKKLDPHLLKSMIGLRVLAGLTYCDAEGNPIEQKQFYGVIESISEKGVVLKHPETGVTFNLPPDLSNYKKASPGEYRLRSTGEVVVNPDILTTWVVEKPKKH